MIKYGSKPFADSIELLRKKLNLPTNNWRDIQKNAHDVAFVVAGARKSAIIASFAKSIYEVISEGRTLADFRKDFDNIVATNGWNYKGSRNWRSNVIYQTNVNTAYAAGRESQFNDPDFKSAVPYLKYVHSNAENARPIHKSWDQMILTRDDLFWQTHTPPNGFGCGCTKVGVSQEALDASGQKVTPSNKIKNNDLVEKIDKTTGEVLKLPKGIDLGWDYRPGDAWLNSQTAQFNPNGLIARIPNFQATDKLPTVRKLSGNQLLADTLTDQQAINKFLSVFGGAGIYKDKAGEAININKNLFINHQGQSKFLKDTSHKKGLLVLALAIKDPDEIWVSLEKLANSKKLECRVVRHYVARFELQDNKKSRQALAVFNLAQDQWEGTTGFSGSNIDKYIGNQRIGVRIYKRK